MKKIPFYIRWIWILAAVVVSCQEDAFEALRLEGPSEVSAVFTIADDNTGLLTVAPAAKGAMLFNIYFGDVANETPTTVRPGQTAKHTYAEGNYNMKIVAVGADDRTAEMTQPITIRFDPPTNLTADVTVSNRSVTVTPKATGATFFHVFFGDVENEEPTVVMPNASATRVYSRTGTFNVRVVAKGAGAATAEITKEVVVADRLLLPLNFEANDLVFNFIGFGGAGATIVDNPDKSGINTTNKVVRFVKGNGAEVWGGVTIELAEKVDFVAFKKFKIKLWSPKPGITFLLKFENLQNPNINKEVSAVSTKTNEWEELFFDFSTVDPAADLRRMALFVDFGNVGDGTVFYFDDIAQTNQGAPVLALPLSFESSALPYAFTNFGGAVADVVDNPDANGNISGKVGRLVKGNGAEVWAGAYLTLPNPIDFSTITTFKVRTWSPKAGAVVKLKVENATDGNIAFEADATTTVANAWEELTYDFSAINKSQSYHKVVIFFDFGVNGNGASYYFDDIRLEAGNAPETLSLPVDFESATLAYAFTNFGGATSEVVNNPDTNGNTSAKVAKLVKGNGAEVWAGSFLTLAAPMSFANGKIFKVRTWSPKAGAVVKLKVENLTDGNIAFEVDVPTTTTNAWEELTFDFSAINVDQSYQKVVIFFDFGVNGNGATYYFDNIRLGN